MTDPPLRIGLGHDTHRLEAGRPLLIGGVVIPHGRGAVAHSDGDVLLHAITDALFGALALGDIGEWFPDTHAQWAGADSARFVSAAVSEVREQGWEIANIDATVFAQQPKLSPFKKQIRQRIAELLGLDVARVNVKAKTGERVGPVGREEAISADAVVLLMRPV